MGVVSKLRDTLGMGESAYEYHCTNCDAEFESKQSKLVDVSCPECAATDIQRVGR